MREAWQKSGQFVGKEDIPAGVIPFTFLLLAANQYVFHTSDTAVPMSVHSPGGFHPDRAPLKSGSGEPCFPLKPVPVAVAEWIHPTNETQLVRVEGDNVSEWKGCATRNVNLRDGDNLTLQGRFQAAQAKFEAGFTEEGPGAACAMDRLARNLRNLGRLTEAETWAVRAVEASRALREKGTTAVLANNLAGVYVDTRQLDKAEVWAKEGLRLATEAFGADHPDTQIMLTTLASVHAYRGDYARAEPLLRRVLFHLGKSYGSNHFAVGLAKGNLADIYRAQHAPQQAIRFYEQALSAFESRPEVAQKQILWVRSGLMLSYSDAGQPAKADALVESTLHHADSTLQPNDPDLAVILHHAAMVRSAASDHTSARRLIERSIHILEGVYGSVSPALAEPLRTYEHILRVGKDRKTAKIVGARVRQMKGLQK